MSQIPKLNASLTESVFQKAQNSEKSITKLAKKLTRSLVSRGLKWGDLLVVVFLFCLSCSNFSGSRGSQEGSKNQPPQTVGTEASSKGALAGIELLEAVKAGDIKKVTTALKQGANPNIKDSRYGRTTLVFAVHRGHKEIVELLLSKGADPNIQDKQGKTALRRGARQRGLELLLSKGADPNIQDKQGKTDACVRAAK